MIMLAKSKVALAFARECENISRDIQERPADEAAKKKFLNSLITTVTKLETEGENATKVFSNWNVDFDKFLAAWGNTVPAKVGELSAQYAADTAQAYMKLSSLQTQIQHAVHALQEEGASTLPETNAALVAGSPSQAISIIVYSSSSARGFDPEKSIA